MGKVHRTCLFDGIGKFHYRKLKSDDRGVNPVYVLHKSTFSGTTDFSFYEIV